MELCAFVDVQNITYEMLTAMSVFWDGNLVTHDHLRCCEQFRSPNYIESQIMQGQYEKL